MTPSLRQRLADAQRRAAGLPVGRWEQVHHGDTENTEKDKGSGTGNKASGSVGVVVPPDSAVLGGLRASVVKGRYEAWCIFASRSCSCSKRLNCRRDPVAVRVVSPAECNPDCPGAVPALRIGAVVTALNEGGQVAQTVRSLAESVGDADLQIILVDDGSTDDSCSFARELGNVRLVRHERPAGVGRARNAGWKLAVELGCNVVSFHDAHMRFPAGGLEVLARRALQSECFVCAGSNGLEHQKGNRLFCCDLFCNRKEALQPKWSHIAKAPTEQWARSPAPMGAGYVMGRATAERLEAATGTLWDDTAGRWGFSEQAIAVKAFLLDIPVLFSRDVVFRHLYRGANPVPDAGTEKWKNAARCTALLFGREVWQRRFEGWCARQLGAKAVARLAEEAFRAATECNTPVRWTRPVEDVFTHLCGKHATVDAPHPEHEWLPEVETACREIVRRTADKPGGAGARVLQWRPGEATLLARRILPKAEISAVEMPGHRADNWWDICGANGIKLLKAKLGRDYPRAGQEIGGEFDLVLVGGEMQEECAALARRLLAPHGKVIVNPAADRNQIEDNELKTEAKALKAHHGDSLLRRSSIGCEGRTESTEKDKNLDNGKTQNTAPTVAVPQAPSGAVPPVPAVLGDLRVSVVNPSVVDPSVTVCLLNWKRPENFGPLLDCLASQTLRPQVFLWDNAPEGGRAPDHELVELSVQSSRNLGCFPRWALAALADTEFVCSMDDDLVFADERVLEDAIAACREECPDGIVGFFGWSEVEGKDYRHGRHHNGTTTGTACDVVKGRFMLMRRALLERVPLEIPTLADFDGLSHREDDVYVSLCISGGRPAWHRIPARLGHRCKDLLQRSAAATAQPGHWQNRDRAIRAIKAWMAARQRPVASGR